MSGPRIITLLTDFGTADGYAGEMKGVLLSLAPQAVVVDIAHDVPPHDVDAGRLTLERVWLRFPPATVHLVVVDPGVGSARQAIAVASEGRFLLGPDNGVLSPALDGRDARAVALPVPAQASATFHGRDVFAPAAARLATSSPLDALGPAVPSPVVRRTPEPTPQGEDLHGQVIAIDRFGNAITNLRAASRVLVGGMELPVRRTYADLEPGQPAAVTGSSGLLEIVLREGRASDALRLQRGAAVIAKL